MATTEFPPEFLAPPPSPAGGAPYEGAKSLENDEFVQILKRSLQIPQLILPSCKLIHRDPPEIDLRVLDAETMRSAMRSIGCFRIVNHGIDKGLVEAVRLLAGRAFQLPPEVKSAVSGFEVDDEEECFWWRVGEEELAGIWPQGYKGFRNKMRCLSRETEKIANKIASALLLNDSCNVNFHSSQLTKNSEWAICLQKHRHGKAPGDSMSNSLKHEILRMLTKNSIRSHSLRIHICKGASSFCVSSKKGCIYFPIKDGAVIVTIGDQIQTWSRGGLYKHVIGKPVFQNREEEEEESISISFSYSNPFFSRTSPSCSATVSGEKVVSLTLQIMIAACLTFICNTIVYYLYSSPET